MQWIILNTVDMYKYEWNIDSILRFLQWIRGNPNVSIWNLKCFEVTKKFYGAGAEDMSMWIHFNINCCCSVPQSCLTLCDPVDCSMPGFSCPSPSSGVCSNSCPLNWWCHPANSSSVIRFSSCLQSFPASGSFQALSSWPKYWSFSISPSSEYSWLISFRID